MACLVLPLVHLRANLLAQRDRRRTLQMVAAVHRQTAAALTGERLLDVLKRNRGHAEPDATREQNEQQRQRPRAVTRPVHRRPRADTSRVTSTSHALQSAAPSRAPVGTYAGARARSARRPDRDASTDREHDPAPPQEADQRVHVRLDRGHVRRVVEAARAPGRDRRPASSGSRPRSSAAPASCRSASPA